MQQATTTIKIKTMTMTTSTGEDETKNEGTGTGTSSPSPNGTNDKDNDVNADDDNAARDECIRQYQFYHSRFPNVPTMTSAQWLEVDKKQKQQKRKRVQQRQGEGVGEFHGDENDNDISEKEQDGGEENNRQWVLVDVRTLPERQVSMIPGAISLPELESKILPKFLNQYQKERRRRQEQQLLLQNNDDNMSHHGLNNEKEEEQQQQQQQGVYLSSSFANDNDDKNTSEKKLNIVTYCTVGYRSSLEARRLIQLYPEVDEIYSMDGILAYTHTPDAPPLVVPSNDDCCAINGGGGGGVVEMRKRTGRQNSLSVEEEEGDDDDDNGEVEVAHNVHTFGTMWEGCANQSQYSTTVFTGMSVQYRLMQVAGLVMVRNYQYACFKLEHLCSCCCRCGSSVCSTCCRGYCPPPSTERRERERKSIYGKEY